MMDELERQVRNAARVLKAAGAREVYLFGSAGTAAMREGSDIDLAVTGLPAEVFFRAMGQAARELERPLDVVDLDERTPFAEYLRKKGKLRRVG
jgi:predicted nucleotidyltransferase